MPHAKRSMYPKARFALAGFVAIGVVCVTVFYVPRLLAIRSLVSRGASYHVEFPGERMLKSWSARLGGKPLDVSGVWHRCGLWVVPFGSVKNILFSSNDGTTDQDIQLLAPFPELEYVDSYEALHVTDASCQALLKFQRLEFLLLRGSKISDAGLAQLGRLRSLKSLSLGAVSTVEDDEVPFTGTGFAAWPSDHGLVEFDADNSGFTDGGIIALARLPKLSVLSLFDCRDIDGEKWSMTPVPIFRSLTEISINPFAIDDRFFSAQPLLKKVNYSPWPRSKKAVE